MRHKEGYELKEWTVYLVVLARRWLSVDNGGAVVVVVMMMAVVSVVVL